MKNYLFNISEEEKENILNRHKTLYDGYAVRQNHPNTQPLYVQDFANDKGGITINSKGEVSTYNNKIYMKEEKSTCSECGLYEEVCECGKGGMYEKEMEEGIYDKQDLSGDFDYVEENLIEQGNTGATSNEKIVFFKKPVLTAEIEEDECTECGESIEEWQEGVYEEDVEKIKESIQESLNWFKKFKNYN